MVVLLPVFLSQLNISMRKTSSFCVSTALLSTTHFSPGLLFLSPLFSLLHSLFYSFYPVASAAIDQFKLLLTGSAGDLWLHLSRTRNPLPSGLAHFILFPLPGLSGLPPSVLSRLHLGSIFPSSVCLCM